MTRLRRYTDPTLPTSKISGVKYPNNLFNKKALEDMAFNPDFGDQATGETSGDPAPSGGRLNLNGLNDVLPYASNLVNSFRKLPLPIAPNLESSITPNLVNYDATRGLINNKLASFNRETDYKTNNSTVGQALKAKALAGGIEGYNQAAQQEGNTNAVINNQTNQFNQGVQVRNLARQQDYNDNLVSRQLKQQELNSENLANTTDKFQLQRRDKNAQYQEGERNYINALGIDRSLLGQTAIDALDELNETQRKRLGYKELGGSLKKYPDGGKIEPEPKNVKYAQYGEIPTTFKQINKLDSMNLYNKGIRPYPDINGSPNAPIYKGRGLGRTASDTEYVGANTTPDSIDYVGRNDGEYYAKLDKAVRSPAFTSLSLKEGYKTPDDFARALVKEYHTENGTKYDVDTYTYKKLPPVGVKASMTRHNDQNMPIKFPDGKTVKYVSVNKRLGGKLKF